MQDVDGGGTNQGRVVAGVEVGGEINCETFTVPAGKRTTVTSDLTVNASGDITIDGDLIGDPAAGCTGYAITLEAGGNLVVTGSVQACDPDVADQVTAKPVAAGKASDLAVPGKDGRHVRLVAAADLSIDTVDRIAATNGTNGYAGAGLVGARGGNGGGIAICVGGDLFIRGVLVLGNGGNGSDVVLTPTRVADEVAIEGGNRYVSEARGGDSGAISVLALGSIDWPHFTCFEETTADASTERICGMDLNALNLDVQFVGAIIGGQGGNAGEVTITDEQDTSSSSTAELTIEGARGGHGWWTGGVGGGITFLSSLMADADRRHGRDVKAIGGKGGNLYHECFKPDVYGDPNKGLDRLYCGDFVYAIGDPRVPCVAGGGGAVLVRAAWGKHGSSQFPDGGNGGNATGIGGDGGDGSELSRLRQTGGDGNSAFVEGGDGGNGWTSYNTAGDGGDGGDSYAYGGNKGRGAGNFYPTQAGGTMVIWGGGGGIGGSCCCGGGGSGGTGGKIVEQPGGHGPPNSRQAFSGSDGDGQLLCINK